MNSPRFEKLLGLMKKAGFDAVALNPGYSMRYLTDLDFHLMERPTVLIIKQDGSQAFILPELESSRAEKVFSKENLFTYGDNPSSWLNEFKAAAAFLGLNKSSIGIEATRLRYLELDFLRKAIPESEILSAETIFSNLRVNKDETEIENMRQAAIIAQKALLETISQPVIGKSEKELASQLLINLLKNGSDELPFSPIVAAGPNSADPHATPSDYIIQSGDLLLFDWGANFNGYASDISRTFAVEKADPLFVKVTNIVHQANQTGVKTGKPGITAGSIDKATREVIENNGFGEFFIHRTGHGLGMEAHETPYIFAENQTILEPGMVFTVEPGIYLRGKGGVRIEDNVVITNDGARSLTDLPRELKIIK